MHRAKAGLLIIFVGLIIVSLAGCKTTQVYPPIQVYVTTIVETPPLASVSSSPTPTTDPTLQPGIIPDAAEYPLSDDLNKTIILKLDPMGSNDLKAGEFIDLAIENLSNQTIVFDADCDFVILQWDEETGQWFRIKNNVTYGQGNEIKELWPRGEWVYDFFPTVVRPQLVGDQEVYDIQILARGYVKGENDTVSRYVVGQLFLQLTK